MASIGHRQRGARVSGDEKTLRQTARGKGQRRRKERGKERGIYAGEDKVSRDCNEKEGEGHPVRPALLKVKSIIHLSRLSRQSRDQVTPVRKRSVWRRLCSSSEEQMEGGGQRNARAVRARGPSGPTRRLPLTVAPHLASTHLALAAQEASPSCSCEFRSILRFLVALFRLRCPEGLGGV